jgi:hypothetical protein
MRALKNIAVEEGYIPDHSREFYMNIMKNGLVYTIPKSRISRRTTLGLPPLPQTKIDDLQKLAEATDIPRLLKGAK